MVSVPSGVGGLLSVIADVTLAVVTGTVSRHVSPVEKMLKLLSDLNCDSNARDLAHVIIINMCESLYWRAVAMHELH